jgi:hypothetical protein
MKFWFSDQDVMHKKHNNTRNNHRLQLLQFPFRKNPNPINQEINDR